MTCGRTSLAPGVVPEFLTGSTDLGNLSYRMPAIHPMLAISGPTDSLHTVEFAEWARSPDGDKAVLDGAKAMAMTIVDLWASADLRDATVAAFAARPTGVEVL